MKTYLDVHIDHELAVKCNSNRIAIWTRSTKILYWIITSQQNCYSI